jgi:hypothetical protein
MRALKNTVLPDPVVPMMASDAPAATLTLRSWMTGDVPKETVSRRASSTGDA